MGDRQLVIRRSAFGDVTYATPRGSARVLAWTSGPRIAVVDFYWRKLAPAERRLLANSLRSGVTGRLDIRLTEPATQGGTC